MGSKNCMSDNVSRNKMLCCLETEVKNSFDPTNNKLAHIFVTSNLKLNLRLFILLCFLADHQSSQWREIKITLPTRNSSNKSNYLHIYQ